MLISDRDLPLLPQFPDALHRGRDHTDLDRRRRNASNQRLRYRRFCRRPVGGAQRHAVAFADRREPTITRPPRRVAHRPDPNASQDGEAQASHSRQRRCDATSTSVSISSLQALDLTGQAYRHTDTWVQERWPVAGRLPQAAPFDPARGRRCARGERRLFDVESGLHAGGEPVDLPTALGPGALCRGGPRAVCVLSVEPRLAGHPGARATNPTCAWVS
jgi:hypothetical protein